MIWLELRTHNTTYNPGWNLKESIWAPTLKENGSKWPFWGLVNNVVKGDIIFHLRHVDNSKQFLGYSVADTDGYLTESSPTEHNYEWEFSKKFYKAELKDFKPLEPVVELADYFNDNEIALREYFNNKGNKHLFYAIQNNRLQCLFGAYFSEFSEDLAKMLLHNYTTRRNQLPENTKTGVSVREIEYRIGQQEFSDNVKNNFNSVCCFPNCPVEGNNFLISGHIARWADNTPMRGHTGNGLCLCLMHDKAFEKGYFTIDENYRVVIVNREFINRKWLVELLESGENLEIKARQINPLREALSAHWERIGYKQ